MGYVIPFSSEEVKVATGKYITISSIGDGITVVSVKDDTSITNPSFANLATISNDAKTYGPFTTDKVIKLDSGGAYLEYVISATPQLTVTPNKSIAVNTALSITAPASTFTTLTYETNAGKVRLVSAGAHGLTSANAVNKYIYVTWSGGTATSGFYKITAIDTDTTGVKITIDLAYKLGLGTAVVKLATQAITVYTDTLAANTLKIGSVMTHKGWFSCTASTNNKTLALSYGGVSVMSYTFAANYASLHTFKEITQTTMAEILSSATGLIDYGVSTSALVRSAVDATASNNLVLTVTLAVADEFVTVEAYKARIEY